jgi:plastocyanin
MLRIRKSTLPMSLACVAVAACGDSGPSDPDPNPDTTPATLSVESGNNQSADVGMTLGAPFVVRVENAGGDPLGGETIDWTVQSGGGSLGSSSSTTDALGMAQTTYTVGSTAGSNQIRAAVRDATNLTATFTATATDPPDLTPALITKVTGDGQSAVVGQALADPLVVRVANAANEALPDVTVNWMVNLGDGTLGSPSSVTNAQGEASTTYTVGAVAGANEIEAAVADNTAVSTQFDVTATAVSSAVSVAVTSNVFTPMDAAVAAGGTVTWSFDQGTHNVTWVSGGFADSGNKSSGTHQVTFAAVGMFDYYCSIHGAPGSGMHGSVDVQ